MKLFQWTACLMALGALASSTLAQTEPKPDAASPAAPPPSVAAAPAAETAPPPPALAPPAAPTAPLPPPSAAQPAEPLRSRYGILPSRVRPTRPMPPQAPPAPEAIGIPATESVTTGIFNEEADQNPEAAIGSYQAVISSFDSQRANVANAIFRLGECYRKLGRMEEAKVQYARILREFTDLPQWVQPSQRHLATPTPRPRAGGYGGGSSSTGAGSGGLGGAGSAGFSSGGGGYAGPNADVIQPPGAGGEVSPGTGASFRDRLTQIVKRSAEDPFSKTAMLKRQLDQAQNEKMTAESKLLRIRTLLQMVRSSEPVNIPEKAAADPRYQELKKEYEKNVMDADNAATEKASQRLSIWVKKIYLPELEAAQRASEIEVKMYHEEFNALADKLKAVQQEEEKTKQPAAGRF